MVEGGDLVLLEGAVGLVDADDQGEADRGGGDADDDGRQDEGVGQGLAYAAPGAPAIGAVPPATLPMVM